ncbi:hypothetical protein HDU86_005738 [Geranomyces michiganensis]|nr:hypothetical protein HDU86_005738 [Geranomyces michiganensis]
MSQKLRKAVDSLLKQTAKNPSTRRTAPTSSPSSSSSTTVSATTKTTTPATTTTAPNRITKKKTKSIPNRSNFRKNERAARRERDLAAAKRAKLDELRKGAAGGAHMQKQDDSERIRNNIMYFLGGKTTERTKEVMEKLKGLSK